MFSQRYVWAFRSLAVHSPSVDQPSRLSFYKETLAGDKDNYVHMRARVERKPPIEVLRQLADENLDSVRRLEELGAMQTGLDRIFDTFLMVKSLILHLPFRIALSADDGHTGLHRVPLQGA